MLEKVTSSDHKRLVPLSLFLSFLFGLLLFQYYRIQIVEGKEWEQRAIAQQHLTVIEPFMRGRFFSNTSIIPSYAGSSQPFVLDVVKYNLYVDPSAIPLSLKNPVAQKLLSFLDFSPLSREKIYQEISRNARSRKLISWLEREHKEKIEKWWLAFAKEQKLPKNGLYFIREFKRSYPFGSLMGNLLQTVQEERDPVTCQSIPTGGLEQFFHEYLQGKKGIKKILSSPKNPLDEGTIIQQSEQGADIYLTINHHLQAILEEELEKGVRQVHAKGGWALLMDPYSGEILALGQYPFFDPRRSKEYFNDPDLVPNTRVKAVMDAYEPGSIMKPLIMSICLQANEQRIDAGKRPIFHPQDKMATHDGKLPGRKQKPLKDGAPHRFLNMYLAVQKSSNIYVSRLVQKTIDAMGEDWFRKALTDVLGFGHVTGVEIPAEISGMVPTPGKKHPNGTLEWSLSTPYSIAMGHNILINSVQVVRAYSMIVNGGFEITPTLVRKIVREKPDGQQEILLDKTDLKNKPPRRRILSENTTDELKRAMKYTTKMGGTSYLGDIPGFTEGGKSGTSEKLVNGQYSQEKYVSSFVGFAPATKPRFVLLVSIDEPEKKYLAGKGKQYHGGICAAPIFKEIGQRVLAYLGVAPDDPFGYPYGDSRRNSSKADWAKEVKSLKDLYERWNK